MTGLLAIAGIAGTFVGGLALFREIAAILRTGRRGRVDRVAPGLYIIEEDRDADV